MKLSKAKKRIMAVLAECEPCNRSTLTAYLGNATAYSPFENRHLNELVAMGLIKDKRKGSQRILWTVATPF